MQYLSCYCNNTFSQISSHFLSFHFHSFLFPRQGSQSKRIEHETQRHNRADRPAIAGRNNTAHSTGCATFRRSDAVRPVQLEKGVCWLTQMQGRVSGMSASDLHFTAAVVETVCTSLAPGALGISRKRLQNAKSDCRFVLRHYGLVEEQRRRQLSPSLKALEVSIADKFRAIQLRRFFSFLSNKGIEPSEVTDRVVEEFRQALHREGQVRRPDRAWRGAIRAWNRERQSNPCGPDRAVSAQEPARFGVGDGPHSRRASRPPSRPSSATIRRARVSSMSVVPG